MQSSLVFRRTTHQRFLMTTPCLAFAFSPWSMTALAPTEPSAIHQAMEAKSHKAIRAETQLQPHSLIALPTKLAIGGKHITAGWLHRIQTVFRNAFALCQAAHLFNLEAFDKKIADLCLCIFAPDSGLRPANMPELLEADRKPWATIAEMVTRRRTLCVDHCEGRDRLTVAIPP